MKIVIVDYGVGNLGSVDKALRHLGFDPVVSADPTVVANCDLMVLPGQGAFGTAMNQLRETGLDNLVKTHIHSGKAFLGICVGFQVLFEGSEEMGDYEGLGILPGTLKKFKPEQNRKVPQMGWNELNIKSDGNEVYKGLAEKSDVYFVHSYYMDANDTDPDIVSATAEYGEEFVAVVQKDKLLATQFHPEKSGDVGMEMIERFIGSLT